jgi:hypothetical protein
MAYSPTSTPTIHSSSNESHQRLSSRVASKISRFFQRRHRIVVVLFFTTYLLMGSAIFSDYGTPTDELLHCRIRGIIFAKQAVNKLNIWLFDKHNAPFEAFYETYPNKDYGGIFEMMLLSTEVVGGLTDARDVTLARHAFIFFMFWLSMCLFYKLIANRFGNWRIGILGCVFLICSPRIFADSFYNSKDIGFLCGFIFSTYSLTQFLENQTIKTAIFHAFCCAFLIDIRIMGIVVPAVTFLFLGIEWLKSTQPSSGKIPAIVRNGLIYTFFLVVFTVLLWPYLWENPLENFVQSFANMSKFNRLDETQLFLGDYIHVTKMPWYYMPVWISITTPLSYLAAFLAGVWFISHKLLKNKLALYQNSRERFDLICLIFFLAPLLAIIVLKSAVYDGWRHLYYTYPSFITIALMGIVSFYYYIRGTFEASTARIVITSLSVLLAINVFYSVYFMIQSHPNQQVYFNALAGKEVEKKFEMDYYGPSYRKGLTYIVETDKRSSIPVYANFVTGKLNASLLKPEDRKRIHYVEDPQQASYFITNYKFEENLKPYLAGQFPFVNEVFAVQVGEAKVMAVYRLK